MDGLIEYLTVRENLEIVFFWSGIALPIVTLGAILYARMQVTVIAKQARATFLLDLIDKWNSADMQKAKAVFQKIDTESKAQVFPACANDNERAALEKLELHFKGALSQLAKDNPADYHVLSRLMNFFELVGMLVKRGYVSKNDVDGLFRGPILQTGAMFKLHIAEKQNEKDVAPGLYENALFLFSEIKTKAKQANLLDSL